MISSVTCTWQGGSYFLRDIWELVLIYTITASPRLAPSPRTGFFHSIHIGLVVSLFHFPVNSAMKMYNFYSPQQLFHVCLAVRPNTGIDHDFPWHGAAPVSQKPPHTCWCHVITYLSVYNTVYATWHYSTLTLLNGLKWVDITVTVGISLLYDLMLTRQDKISFR